MCKDHIVTSEQKLYKKQRLEENRRLRTTQINNSSNDMQSETPENSPDINTMHTPVSEENTEKVVQTRANAFHR